MNSRCLSSSLLYDLTQGPRALLFEERATWGVCPICHAGAGEGCRETGNSGLPSEKTFECGELTHVARVCRAPRWISATVGK